MDPKKASTGNPVASASAHLGFEAQVWASANKMRGHMESYQADIVLVGKDLAKPSLGMRDWDGENLRQEVCWKFGMPPMNNANYACFQHAIRHLSPVGLAGFVMTKTKSKAQERQGSKVVQVRGRRHGGLRAAVNRIDFVT